MSNKIDINRGTKAEFTMSPTIRRLNKSSGFQEAIRDMRDKHRKDEEFMRPSEEDMKRKFNI